MKYIYENRHYEGSPQEIADLLKLLEGDPDVQIKQDDETTSPSDDFEPLVDESVDLRKKLADDPNYNPYGGVIPSKEPKDVEESTLSDGQLFTAEDDTGVKLV